MEKSPWDPYNAQRWKHKFARRTTAWCRSRASWGMAWDPKNVRWWKHEVGFHNRGVQWDTPMARGAGEGNDWIKLVALQKSQGRRNPQHETSDGKEKPHPTGPDRQRNQEMCFSLNLINRKLGSHWRSKSTTKRSWTGSMVTPS